MPTKAEEKRRKDIIDATMKLAADKDWPDITLLQIAKAADLSLTQLRENFSSKDKILMAFMHMIDEKVMEDVSFDENDTYRERVFELIMSRFEHLAPYRDAVARLYDSRWQTLFEGPGLALKHANSQRWMLEAAEMSASGAKGLIRTGGLSALYARIMPVWLDDDTDGFSRTMAELDKKLEKVEGWAKRAEKTEERLCKIVGRIVPFGLCRKHKRAGASKAEYDEDTDNVQTS